MTCVARRISEIRSPISKAALEKAATEFAGILELLGFEVAEIIRMKNGGLPDAGPEEKEKGPSGEGEGCGTGPSDDPHLIFIQQRRRKRSRKRKRKLKLKLKLKKTKTKK